MAESHQTVNLAHQKRSGFESRLIHYPVAWKLPGSDWPMYGQCFFAAPVVYRRRGLFLAMGDGDAT